MSTNQERSPTNYADQSNIFYTHCPIREVLLALSIRRKTKKSNQLLMREKGVPEALLYANAGEKNTKDGDARSVQPL